MRRTDWPVGDHGIRPAGRPDKCFYCGAEKGAPQHNEGCVIRSRTVVVEVRALLLRVVPEDWTHAQIEFHMNLGSSCAGNLLDEIDRQAARQSPDTGCPCDFIEGKFVREALPADEERFKRSINEEPT